MHQPQDLLIDVGGLSCTGSGAPGGPGGAGAAGWNLELTEISVLRSQFSVPSQHKVSVLTIVQSSSAINNFLSYVEGHNLQRKSEVY